MAVQLFIGGLVAAGFDKTGDYLLTISHSGRGVFSTKSWMRIARDHELSYPNDGVGIGIGPIHGEEVPVVEMDLHSEQFKLLRKVTGSCLLAKATESRWSTRLNRSGARATAAVN